MTELAKDVAAIDVTDLLTRYGFDLSESTLDRLVSTWLDRYPTQWVRLAVIEALYQGRYKAISVEQILNLWQRRGKSLYRFNHEFERVVCGRFSYTQFSTPVPRSTASSRSGLNSSIAKASKSTLSTPPVSNPISSAATPGVSAPQPVLPEVDLESDPESIVVSANPPDSSVSNSNVLNSNVLNSNDDIDRVPNLGSSSASYAPNEPGTPESSTTSPLTDPAPVTIFQPVDRLTLEPLVALNAARSISQHEPIHHFVPSSQSSQSSDFCAKLRAVAQTVVATSGE